MPLEGKKLLAGRVVLPGGAPAAAVQGFIDQHASSGYDRLRFVTDQSGRFEVEVSDSGPVTAFVEVSEVGRAAVSFQDPPAQVELALDAGARLRVRLLGTEAGPLFVSVHPSGPSPVAWGQPADEVGVVRFVGLPAGPARLEVSRRGVMALHEREVVLRTGELTEIDVVLGAMLDFSGHVTVSGKQPMPRLLVLDTIDGRNLSTAVADDGAFLVRDLSRGAWRLRFFADAAARTLVHQISLVQLPETPLQVIIPERRAVAAPAPAKPAAKKSSKKKKPAGRKRRR